MMEKIKKLCQKWNWQIYALQKQTRGEELANTAIHALGAELSVAALALLLVFGSRYGDVWHVVSFSIFGATLIFLYLSSTLFHFFQNKKKKDFFRLFDYSGIFLLIAGTYTPITLVFMRGPWGWTFFGIVWGIALVGIFLRIFETQRVELLLAVLYVVMGWSIIIAVKPFLSLVPKDYNGLEKLDTKYAKMRWKN